ncbi:MAG: discoidin domain-containing protein, partial [Aridibacter sp.]
MAKRIVNPEDNLSKDSSNKTDKTTAKKQGFVNRLRNIERQKLFSNIAVVGLVLLVSIGALAQMGLLPHKDQETGKKYGWFGQELAVNATSLWNPFASSPQTGTPQLSKEYVYAGDRLLAIEETGSGASSTPTPTATPTPTPSSGRINYALASMGSVATASSADSNYLPYRTINGDRTGYNWSSGNLWVSLAGMPQWLQVDFGQSRTIDEINVFHAQETAENPVEPTPEMTYTINYTSSFEVQYWNGSTWINLASVTGNNKIWRNFTFSPVTTSKIRINLTATTDTYAYLTEVEAIGNNTSSTPTPTPTPTPTVRTNYALASNGALATASTADSGYLPVTTNDGDRRGTNSGNLSMWISVAPLPDWLQIDFGQSRTIDEIDVITVQDDAFNPVEPTLAMEFTSTYGNVDFNVQYWNGSAWVTLNSVTGNRKVWKQFTFAPITTSKIRVNITGSADDYAYMTEVEA